MIVLDSAAVLARATIGECADALERYLLAAAPRVPGPTAQEGARPGPAAAGTPAAGSDPSRTFVGLPAGELIVMPSRMTGTPTVKLVTVADDPASPGGRIKGVHVVFDAESLAVVAVIDAAALTLRRTAALSLVALRRLADEDADRLLLFGSGPQARAHLDAVAAEWPLTRVGVAARDRVRAERFAADARSAYPELAVDLVEGDDLEGVVGRAGIIVCATTSPAPVFGGASMRDGACVVAVGSHRADRREVPTSVMSRAFVVVEERSTAMHEAGDVVVAVGEGAIRERDLVELGELLRDEARDPGASPRVFKSVGMAWQDAVVSALMVERSQT